MARRKYAPKRRLRPRRRRIARRLRRTAPMGRFQLSRKTALISTYANTAVAGAIVKNDPTGTCLDIGTPVPVLGTINCYDIPFSLVFRLDQLMNSGDITSFADQYKINSVKVKLHANGSAMYWAGQNGIGQPWVEYIQDYDDADVPSLALMREKMGVKTKFFSGKTQSIVMGVRPRTAGVVFGSGVSTTYAVNKASQYINATYPNVEHYGIKGVLHNVHLNGTVNVTSLFEWDVTQYITAKNLQ